MVYVTDPKKLAPKDRIRYIVEVMAMRARGRADLKKAALKRVKRAQNRAKQVVSAPSYHRHLGMVDDAEYGDSVHLGCRPYQTPSLVPALKTSEGRTSYNPQGA
jgi:hypothetical protein